MWVVLAHRHSTGTPERQKDKEGRSFSKGTFTDNRRYIRGFSGTVKFVRLFDDQAIVLAF